MCGIAGIVTSAERLKSIDLDAAGRRIAHRGPDDQGRFAAGGTALVHTRLSIIDLDGGHQPLHSDDGRHTLVANGEVYNYVELREDQAKRGCRFVSRSDSEAIIHAWALDGPDGLHTLRGMYAFALHDRDTGEVVLGRDRLGIKPLFYAALPDRVVFASEIKALLALLPQAPQIDAAGLLQYLQNQFHTGPDTIFEGVQRVLPGQCLRIGADLRVHRFTYWSALDVRPTAMDPAAAEQQFEELFDQVMHEHMRADVPFGLFLSGGVDSAVLLAMLKERMDTPLTAYSVGFSDTAQGDELEQASWLAARFGIRHVPLKLTREQVFRRLVHTVWAADELMRDYASLPTSLLAERASADLKVVFSGEGGDEVFAGYRRYRPSPERWLKSLLRPGTGGFRTRGNWRGLRARRVFGPALRSDPQAARRPFVTEWSAAPSSWSNLQRAQYVDLVTSLPDNLLVKTDRVLMSFALEGRVPFLDHRVVEFGLGLPDELKLAHGRGKLLLRRWAAKRIPADYLDRPKRGFHVPIGEWLHGEFLTHLAAKLRNNDAVREWFAPTGIEQLLRAQARHGNAARELWSIMQFAIWHNLFVERPGTAPTPDESPLDWIS